MSHPRGARETVRQGSPIDRLPGRLVSVCSAPEPTIRSVVEVLTGPIGSRADVIAIDGDSYRKRDAETDLKSKRKRSGS